MSQSSVPVSITAKTKFILSTSGRPSSLLRYKILLQELLGIDVAYIPINSGDELSPQISPQRFVWALKGMPCIGGAISRDIKHAIIPFLDEVEGEAKAIQSVNTVIVKGSKLIGYNTDATGFKVAISKGIENKQIQSAVCYGYGGVVSVVIAVLKTLGIDRICICGRRLDEAKRRAEELGVQVWTEDMNDIDLFVNATPTTDHPLEQASNLLACIKPCKVAFDHEMPGKYLKEYCDHHGIHHIPGTDMYYPQMIAQWSLFLEDLHIDVIKLTELLQQADDLSKQ